MLIRLNGKKSIYEQIVEEYGRYIRAGAFRAGEKLPSCRALAAQLGINPNTVERAYSELEREGLIHTIPKKGVFVCDAAADALAEEARRQITALKAAGLSHAELMALAAQIYQNEGGNDD